MNKISYAILVKDEVREIQKLISNLNQYRNDNSEIIVVQDVSVDNEQTLEVKNFLINQTLTSNVDGFFNFKFKNNFAEIKNYLNSKCTGDYIFNIDADETISSHLLNFLPDVLSFNKDVDLFWVPRINIVNGLTNAHILKWGWKMTKLEQFSDEVVNWPDYQGRIYRNTEDIKWIREVHEIISGNKSHVFLPQNPDYAIIHVKDIGRQEKQNEHYSRIMKNG